MGKLLWVLVALLVVGVAAFFLMSSQSSLTGNVVSDNTNDNSGNTNSGDMKTFVVTGENFKFVMNGADNPDIKVKQGDKVRIEFKSTTGFHDWVVDEFNAATKQVNAGGSSFVEFTADKKGTFEYYCSVGQHRQHGMKGNLIVE